MRAQEFLGDARISFACLVDYHWHEESGVLRHVQESPRGEVPFAAEVTLGSGIGVR